MDSNFGTSDDLHTVDQLRSYFNDALYATNYENAIVDYLMSNSTFKELPSEITSYYIRMFLNYYNQYATAYGMDLNAFAQTQATPMPMPCWPHPTLTLSIWQSRT